ncbi:MAG TPA: WYL domain-containing protein [Burkholderiales bacterium]
MAPPNVLQVLTRAIRERRLVALRYQDQRAVRVVEPHAVYTDEYSQLMLDAYQVRGYSSSGRPLPFWRPFRVRRIATVELLKETFQPRTAEGFSPSRLKYRNGLVAIVETAQPAFAYPPEALLEVGPPRPPHLRRAV